MNPSVRIRPSRPSQMKNNPMRATTCRPACGTRPARPSALCRVLRRAAQHVEQPAGVVDRVARRPVRRQREEQVAVGLSATQQLSAVAQRPCLHAVRADTRTTSPSGSPLRNFSAADPRLLGRGDLQTGRIQATVALGRVRHQPTLPNSMKHHGPHRAAEQVAHAFGQRPVGMVVRSVGDGAERAETGLGGDSPRTPTVPAGFAITHSPPAIIASIVSVWPTVSATRRRTRPDRAQALPRSRVPARATAE